jgi:hypothetical protein
MPDDSRSINDSFFSKNAAIAAQTLAYETTYARPNVTVGTVRNIGCAEMKRLLMTTAGVLLCTVAHADMLFVIPPGVSEGSTT